MTWTCAIIYMLWCQLLYSTNDMDKYLLKSSVARLCPSLILEILLTIWYIFFDAQFRITKTRKIITLSFFKLISNNISKCLKLLLKGFMLILAEPWNYQFLFQMFWSSNINDDIMSLYLKCTYSSLQSLILTLM